LFGFLKKTDALGFFGGLQFAQQTIQGEIQHQVSNIAGSIADLQRDVVTALSQPLH
jgi:hypothetical protein